MTDDAKPAMPPMPTLEDWQHWTYVMGRAQQMMMEFWAQQSAGKMPAFDWTKAMDPAAEPADHREFYGKVVAVTKDNVEEYYKTNVEAQPTIDWTDLWGRVVGQIRT